MRVDAVATRPRLASSSSLSAAAATRRKFSASNPRWCGRDARLATTRGAVSGAGADADSKGKSSSSSSSSTTTGRRDGGGRNRGVMDVSSPLVDVARRTLRYDASGGAHFDRDSERRKSMSTEDARRIANEKDAVVFLCDAKGARVMCGVDEASSSSLAYARCQAVTAALGRRSGERFDGGDACYVGRDVGRDSRAVFAVTLPREGEKRFGVDGETLRAAFEEALGNTDDASRSSYEMVNVKSASARAFDESDAAIAANGASLAGWAAKQRYCRSCGSKMRIVKGGQKAVCVECRGAVYPELMACCLSLITCGNYVLLGRNAKWPKNFYSLPAGFVESSESLEASVVREAKEETSVELLPASVEYVMSQPWPFPNQLMIGFRAAVEPVRLGPLKMPPVPKTIDSELADARWFHVDYLAPRLTPERSFADPREIDVSIPFGEIALPGEHALARQMIQMWVNEKMSYRRRRCDDRLVTTVVEGSFFTECELSSGDESVDSSFVEDDSGNFQPLHFVMCEVLLAQEGQAPVVIRAAPGDVGKIRADVVAEVEQVGQGARAVAYVRATGRIKCKKDPSGSQSIQVKMLSEASDDGFDARAITIAMLEKACPFHKFTFD